jgi:uncharacterized membrane-anchored protein
MSADFKFPADTPRVSRSPFVERGKAIVIEGSQFEDGQRRLIVSQGVSDEDAAKITDFLTEAETEQARIAEQVAIFERLMERTKEDALRWADGIGKTATK